MRNFLLILLISGLFAGCNTYKRAQKDIYSGNFDEALDGLIKKYAKRSIKEKDIQRWAGLFNDAYVKANQENIEQIQRSQFLVEGSEKYRVIYNSYISLQTRYDKLKPYLPIKVNDIEIPIHHENFYTQLENSQRKLADALNAEGEILLKNGDKFDSRNAFGKFSEIAHLIPNYPQIKDRLDLAYQKGLTHILLTVNNDSRSILPRNLHQDLTYIQMDNNQFFWQKFHNQPGNYTADYFVELNFKEISLTPELIDRKMTIVEKSWTDSSIYVKDERGRPVRDSSGRQIKHYTQKKVSCKVFEIFQKKSAMIQSEFIILDAQQRLLSRVSPINSRFDFDNVAYKIEGDEMALEEKFLRKIRHSQFMPFPNDEQMVFDCGQDIKSRFSQFLAAEAHDK
jgi:predicted small secreted protein